MLALSRTESAVRAERVTEPLDTVGESPVWRAGEESLYWVDIAQRRIHRLHLASGRRDTWTTAEAVACIAFAADGTVVAGMESGIFRLTLGASGALEAKRLAAPRFPMAGMRFNDGRCDRQGRFWAGTMHTDMPAAHAVGSLYRYTDEEGLSAPAARGLLTQNGLAFSPAGERMYLSDSHPAARVVWVYDYECETGTPYGRRVFVDMTRHPGRPDGAAVDEDGCYWTCANDAGQVLRFTPAGALDRALALPVKKPSMCAFGGARLDTLYVTTIRPAKPEDAAAQPLAGAVFALRPGVRGLAETDFKRRAP
jgi:sugar lactone lactonase YvrE